MLKRLLQRVRYGPFVAQIVITRKCNLSCGYCNEYDKTSDPIPLDVLKRRIDKLHELGTTVLTLTGGEPLLHPGIFELLTYARTRFTVRSMITNAYLLTEDTVRRLNESGLNGMQISIDGAKPNATTVKVLEPLKSKLRMVARTAKFSVNLNSVVGAAPPSEVLDVLAFARECGFQSTVQIIHDGQGQIKLTKEEREVYRTAKRLARTPFWSISDHFEKLMDGGSAPFKCRAGSRYLYIDEFGNVCWCSQMRHAFHKPLEEYTPGDLKEQFFLKKGCEDKCTLNCVRIASRVDAWRPYGA